MAEYLNHAGRFDEALKEIGRAEQLDPLSPIIATDHGTILHYARHQADAVATGEGASRLPRLRRGPQLPGAGGRAAHMEVI